METLEKIEKIKAFQGKVKEVQGLLKDVTVSEGGELQVTMDGNIQILEIKWLIPVVSATDQAQILVKTINRAIVSINMKLKQAMQQITQSMNLPNLGM